MKVPNIQIRLLTSPEELEQVRDLEAKVWDGDDPTPVHQTATAVKHGGIVLGAYDGDQLIGFQYSFAGFNGTKTYLCSHILGITPEYRSSGIGAKLKWHQRTEALAKGYDLITWTYDPLETANGYLNIKKLGAICRSYLPNFYGEMTDTLNEGLPSDRFMVEWWIKSDKVSQKADQKQHQNTKKTSLSLIQTSLNPNGLPTPESIVLNQMGATTSLIVPVPASFQTLKKQDAVLAKQWRMYTRDVFTHYFQHGWKVDDFMKSESSKDALHYYVLSK
ncbi:hypothetical protein [Shimazuella kribbensis]|uniref:hypothetical protein n=1 Tax=Shimazuella kribbensis TaxID=139808 RepID=UPI00042634A7|nr:hypothetical protein [Shimazuella kribbensis]